MISNRAASRENLPTGFPNRSDTNGTVKPQKMVRGLKFKIYEVEGILYLDSESKGADQLHSYCAADLRLCFRICKNRFSHDGSQYTYTINSSM